MVKRTPEPASRYRTLRNRKTLHEQRVDFATLSWLLPCMVAAAIYLPSTSADFIYDDTFQIVDNPQVHSWKYLSHLLTSDVWSQRGIGHHGFYYRPLFSVWLLFMHSIGGLNTVFWHLSSIGLNVIVTFLVFRICNDLVDNRLAASCAALLFAVHPVHVETVAWVSASNEMLYAGFLLASLLSFRSFLRDSQVSILLLSVIFWSASLLCKETALAMLPVFFLLGAWPPSLNPHSNIALTVWRRSRLHCLIALLYIGVRHAVLRTIALPHVAQGHTWVQVLWTSPSVIGFYIRKLLCPVGLSTFYSHPVHSTPSFVTILGLTVLLAFIAGTLWLTMRNCVALSVGVAIIVLPLLPVVVAVRSFKAGDLTHDRYLYLPTVGLCLVVALAVRHFESGSKRIQMLAAAPLVGILVSFSVMTVFHQPVYRNDDSFFERAQEIAPDDVIALDHLGNTYLREGRLEEAIRTFSSAQEVDPENVHTEFYLGRALLDAHQSEAARPHLESIANPTSDEVPLYLRKAVLLALAQSDLLNNRPTDTDFDLQRLRDLDPRYPGLHRTLAIIQQRRGNLSAAQHEYATEYEISHDLECGKQALLMARALGQSK